MDIRVDENTVIVFDLDDTLYNELDYLKSAYLEIAKILAPLNYRELFSTMFSLYRDKKNVFQYLNNHYDVEISSLIANYRNHQPSIKMFRGALELLESIKKNKGRLGIITDGRINTQMAKIKALQISHIIDYIVISEEIGTEKPNVQNFELIEQKLEGNFYYYIADNLKKDFITPKKMGWKTIALIDNGKNIHHDSNIHRMEEYCPEHFVFGYEEFKII